MRCATAATNATDNKGDIMKSCRILLALSVLALIPGCRESEIDNKPAAAMADAASATTMDTMLEGAQPAPGAVTANVIKEKSSINFVAAKVTRDHKGQFNTFDGSIEYADGKPSRISFEIDLASVETDTPKLTGHLKTADFFDVAKHPKATFVSTAIGDAAAGSPAGTTHTLTGTLNLHGMDKEVTIPVVTQATPEGIQATSEFTINRHDWGVSYKGAADDLIKDEVLIKLDMMFPPPPAA
jgi:polyisoprenoid-binding protein YceI